MSTQRPPACESRLFDSSSTDDRDLEILGRCLDDLGGDADKEAVIRDYCARYPDLADKIRDLAQRRPGAGRHDELGRSSPGRPG